MFVCCVSQRAQSALCTQRGSGGCKHSFSVFATRLNLAYFRVGVVLSGVVRVCDVVEGCVSRVPVFTWLCTWGVDCVRPPRPPTIPALQNAPAGNLSAIFRMSVYVVEVHARLLQDACTGMHRASSSARLLLVVVWLVFERLAVMRLLGVLVFRCFIGAFAEASQGEGGRLFFWAFMTATRTHIPTQTFLARAGVRCLLCWTRGHHHRGPAIIRQQPFG